MTAERPGATAGTRSTSPVPHRGPSTAWTLGGPALIVAVTTAVALSWSGDLPDPVATHIGPTGEPDNFGPLLPHVLAPGGIVMAFGLFMWSVAYFAGRAAFVRRIAAMAAVWFAGMLMGTVLGSLALQRGLADATDTPSTDGVVAIAFAAASVLGVAAAYLIPGDAPQPTRAPVPPGAPTLDLDPDEQVTWVRDAGQRAFLIISAVAVAGTTAMAAAFDTWGVALIGVAVAALMAAVMRWTVVVDRRGLTVRSLLRRPRVVVPLDEVLQASVSNVRPLVEFGGWGLRVGRRGRVGVVVRAGEALEVERTGGRVFVVTVDDAATAAALLNSLAARSRA